MSTIAFSSWQSFTQEEVDAVGNGTLAFELAFKAFDVGVGIN
jgi:hypothetical protein